MINETIEKAMTGERGPDQRVIAEVGLHLVQQLLRKNRDYGSCVFDVPVLTPGLDPGAAILVRMSDKIQRIQRLSQNPEEVAGESLADSFADLAGYAILWLVQRELNR